VGLWDWDCFVRTACSVDTSNASGRFFVRIMGALAEMERELIGERTAAALAYKHKRARGERLGTTPLGFRTPGPGEAPVPVPDELEVVKQILRRWRRGWSFRRIASALNTEGVKTKRGGHWHHSTVQGVVKRRASYRPYLEAI
jgi:DNA invertase Pin-like site-specific DNA recombinase